MRLLRGVAVLVVLAVSVLSAGADTNGMLSPFAYGQCSVFVPGYPDNGYVDALNIGVKWAQEGKPVFWFLVQPDLGVPDYDFDHCDDVILAVPTNIVIVGAIAPESDDTQLGRCLTNSWVPVNQTQYVAYVKAVVERFDGDGTNDAPGLVNPVRYWQVGNEPTRLPRADFALLQELSYRAVKKADPGATVVMGAASGSPDGYVPAFTNLFVPILSDLNGQYADVFDFHWFGLADGDYRLRDRGSGADVLDAIRQALVDNGFPSDMPIWTTETSAYSGLPSHPEFPLQTEQQQAADYFRRIIYPRSRGVTKIFPTFLLEGFEGTTNGYYDHVGVIYDGDDVGDLGLGVKKLAYYMYKKMTETLGGSDWDSLTNLHYGAGTDDLYLFRVTKTNEPIHIAWWDYFDDPTYTPGDQKLLTISNLAGLHVCVCPVVPDAEFGQDVSNYATAFPATRYEVSDGSAVIMLGDDPVYITRFTTNPVTPCGFPAWWLARGAMTLVGHANDFGAVNQGQLKWVARQAYLEMQAEMTGGAGVTVSNLVAGFSATNNYQAVTLGQLKATAKPFYDRLGDFRGQTNYPWTETIADDNDYGAANLGQVKNTFDFEIEE